MKLRTALLLLAGASCAESYALPAVIDNSAYPANAAPSMAVPATSAPSNNTVFELMGRMEQMQAEIQQLTGKVEEQANQITELKKQQSSMYGDFDDRLQSLESGKAAGTEAVATPDATVPSEPKVSTATADKAQPIDSSENLAAAAKQSAATAKPQVVQASESEKSEYQDVYNLLRTNRIKEAIPSLQAYIQKYPSGKYATNAQYWLGEAYRINKDPASAHQAFNDVIGKYPNSDKVPDALLMLGILEADQKNTDKAREYYNRVASEFPNTVAAKKAAKKLLLLETQSN
jgi:tol-pal system protein YbgF